MVTEGNTWEAEAEAEEAEAEAEAEAGRTLS